MSSQLIQVLFSFVFYFVLYGVSALYAAEPLPKPMLRIEPNGHVGDVTSAASDKEGRIVATASIDKTVRIWETGTGRLLNTLRVPITDGREGILNAVAVSPDDKTIVTGGETGKAWDSSYAIYFIDPTSGKILRRVNSFNQIIRDIKFSPDGKQIVIATGDDSSGEAVVVNSGDSNIIARHKFSSSCESIDISSTGQIAAVTKDGYLYIYLNEKDNSPRKIKPSADTLATSCAFNPKGTHIAIGTAQSFNIFLINIDDMSIKVTRPNNTVDSKRNTLSTIAWSYDGEHLYTAGTAGFLIPDKRGEVLPKTRGIYAYNKQGYGLESRFPVDGVTKVVAIVPLKSGNIFFAMGMWGVVESDSEGNPKYISRLLRPTHQKKHDQFSSSSDGMLVKFKQRDNEASTIFDLTTKTLSNEDEVDLEFFIPKRSTEQINLQRWDSWIGNIQKTIPKLNKRILRDFKNTADTPFSFGIAHDEESFFIGAAESIRKYDKHGTLLWKMPTTAIAFALALSKNGKLLVIGFSDGSIRWYNQSDGAEQAAFYPHPDRKRWVLWTPEGYFDASQNGSELIGYHINQSKDKEPKFIPISNLYDVFYRPDIIQARLKGEDIRTLVTLTAEEALQAPPPEVKFTTQPVSPADAKTKICYQLKSTGGGIGEVRMFHNGKLIRSDGYYREVAKAPKTEKIQLASLNSRALYSDMRSLAMREKKLSNTAVTSKKGDLVDECVEVDTIAGENEISVAAFNATNSVQSPLQTTAFFSKRQIEEPHLYILSVGIDKYIDSKINLKYAVKDAKDFISKLSEKAQTIFKPENIHLATITNEQATRHNILKTADELSKKIKHGDSFIFFNASHGVLLQNQYYIVTADYNGNLDDTSTLISSNQIIEISKQIKSLSQLFIFDTCHAGGVDNIVSGLYDARMSVLAKKMGLHIYASAGSVQTAMDGYKGNGLYTYALLNGITNGKDVDKNKTGKVSVVSLGQYSKEKTTELSSKAGHNQVPLIINFGRDSQLFSVR